MLSRRSFFGGLFAAPVVETVSRAWNTCSGQQRSTHLLPTVRDYGAIGDGRHDDTGAVQAALAANGVVFFSPGTYSVSTVELNVPGTRIIGSGVGHTILRSATQEPVLRISASPVEIQDLTIDGAGRAAYGIFAMDGGAIRSHFSAIEIRDVLGEPGIGFANVNHSHSMLFDRCQVWNNRIGIRLLEQVQNSVIDRCLIYGNHEVQVQLGAPDTGHTVMITLRATQLERARARQPGDVINLLVYKIDPLLIDGCYFESHSTPGSADIRVAGRGRSRLQLTASYAYGNFGQHGLVSADSSILLDAPADLLICSCNLWGYAKSVLQDRSEGLSRVLVQNSSLNGATTTGEVHGIR